MYRGDALGDGHPSAAQLSRSEAPRLALGWQRNLGAAIDGAPAVGGVVVVGSAGGKLAAYMLETGSTVWEDNGLGAIMGSAAIVGQQVLVATLTGRVYAIGLGDGRTRWTWRAPDATAAIWSSPTPYRNLILIGIAAAGVCYPMIRLVKSKLEIDDSLDVFAVHGIGGMTGSLLLALFMAPSLGGTGDPASSPPCHLRRPVA